MQKLTTEFFRRNHLLFAAALCATMVTSAINLVLAWLIQQMIDTASGVGAFQFAQLAWLTAATVGLIVAAKGLAYITKPRFIKRAMTQYKLTAFARLTKKSIDAFGQEATASYLSAFTNDAASVEENFLESYFELPFQFVMMVGAVAMMLWYSPLLTAVAIAFFLLPLLVSLVFGKKMEAAEVRVSKRNERFLAMMKDSLSGFPVVKSFKAEQPIRNLFEKETASLEQEKCRKQKVSIVLRTLGGIAGVTAQMGTFLVGIWLSATNSSITPGVLVLFLQMTGNVINPINTLPNFLAKRKAARALIAKLETALAANVREEGEQIPVRLQSGVSLQNVSFGYQEGSLARFEAGKSYAVVGASGSGKSTLLKLLMAGHGSYSGSIRFDDHELQSIHSQSLYDLISVIQQDVFVFDDTIANNITMFQSFPAQEVEGAAARSGLSELMAEKGADYRCGENGNQLSGGEKQRISIARSLLRKAPVLLVDEATAALDRETAWLVSDSILNLRELTRIVVTHALDAELLRRYDEILVMKKGQLVEQGQFDELMAQKGDFFALYTSMQ